MMPRLSFPSADHRAALSYRQRRRIIRRLSWFPGSGDEVPVRISRDTPVSFEDAGTRHGTRALLDRIPHAAWRAAVGVASTGCGTRSLTESVPTPARFRFC